MDKTQLESFLRQSLADGRFDNQEKRELRERVVNLDDAQRNFVRNKAFDIARDVMSSDEHLIPAARVLAWLQKIVKVCKHDSDFSQSDQAFFSPGDSCREAIVQQIHSAREQVDICVFTISDDRITEAILKAHERKLNVRVISDNDKSHDRGSDIERMRDAGLALRLDNSPYHMHHKFALVDRRLLINGSFNWTRSASTKNQENIVLTQEPELLNEFGALFEQLWETYA